MLEWELMTGDKKLRREIERTKNTFDAWFNGYWAKVCSKEKMLSPGSPMPHVYYKMCLPFDEVKLKLPNWTLETCSDCGKSTDIWLETSFSFCDEYGCGMSLCPECARKLKSAILALENKKESNYDL